AYFFVEKEFIAKSLTFTLAFSAFLLVFKNHIIDLSPFVYVTENGTSTILAPIAAGVLNGMMFTSVIKTGGSMGGMDIVAACIRKVKPHLNMNSVIFALNTSVAMISYFVYDFNIEPVILCIMYCFISSQMSEKLLQGVKRAVKFEIVSNHFEEISKEIIEELHHSVTVMPAVGMYTHKETKLMVCVVNKREVHDVQQILAKYPGTFAYTTNVTETMGNFMRQRTGV
ncbi:MAG: YitT family protein, partial [Oscillospiraceae bacterium]|nr:YitT family protein [Oscillospiraceae bacterium]